MPGATPAPVAEVAEAAAAGAVADAWAMAWLDADGAAFAKGAVEPDAVGGRADAGPANVGGDAEADGDGKGDGKTDGAVAGERGCAGAAANDCLGSASCVG